MEQWSLKWDFRFSVEKKQILYFSEGGKITEEYKLKLYGRVLETVNVFRFLGVWFDSRLTWKTSHGKSYFKMPKKFLNVMRCVAGQGTGVLTDSASEKRCTQV